MNKDIGLPNGLTFDPFSKLLCWADAGNSLGTGHTPSTEGENRLCVALGVPAVLFIPFCWPCPEDFRCDGVGGPAARVASAALG